MAQIYPQMLFPCVQTFNLSKHFFFSLNNLKIRHEYPTKHIQVLFCFTKNHDTQGVLFTHGCVCLYQLMTCSKIPMKHILIQKFKRLDHARVCVCIQTRCVSWVCMISILNKLSNIEWEKKNYFALAIIYMGVWLSHMIVEAQFHLHITYKHNQSQANPTD